MFQILSPGAEGAGQGMFTSGFTIGLRVASAVMWTSMWAIYSTAGSASPREAQGAGRPDANMAATAIGNKLSIAVWARFVCLLSHDT